MPIIKYIVFCVNPRGTDQGSRDAKAYDFSCVSWINYSINPEPCCGVITISFSLVCFRDLSLEFVYFLLSPL